MNEHDLRYALEDAGLAVSGELGTPCSFVGAHVDSRKIAERNLFVALPGRHADGHSYVIDAIRNGARVVLARTDRRDEIFVNVQAVRLDDRCWIVAVDEPLAALQALARAHLNALPDLVRVAITGSNGKTTTKELVASILATRASTYRSRGNLNSEIGVPIAALEVSRTDKYAVFEVAMDGPGQIETLARIVRPHFAMVTNTAMAHTEFVGSQEAVAREKRMIFSQFTGEQTAVVPADDAYAGLLASGIRGRVVRFGSGVTPQFDRYSLRGFAGGVLRFAGRDIAVHLVGRAMGQNALAAAVMAREIGVGLDGIQSGIESVRAMAGRAQVLKGECTVILDCYNANPESMHAALDLVGGGEVATRQVCILGSMLEIGANSRNEHCKVGRRLAELPVQAALLVGEHMRDAREAAEEAGFRGVLVWSPTVDEAQRAVQRVVRKGDVILIKGSRAVGLEHLLPAIDSNLAAAVGDVGTGS